MTASLPTILASFAALTVALAPTPAHAQGAPAPASAPPTYGQAPAGYAPPAYGQLPAGYAPPAYGQLPAGYAPPAYGQLPAGYPPPAGYAPNGAAPSWYAAGTPGFETKRRSSAMLGAGIAMLALGGTGLIIGSSLFAAGDQTHYVYPPCLDGFDCSPTLTSDSGLKNGGIATLVISVAMLVAGTPLTLVGMQKVPVHPAAAALVPELRGSALRWRFQ
jgi:hypothetical protein